MSGDGVLKKDLYNLIFLCVLVGFLAVKIISLVLSPNDENMYFYLGKLVSEGKLIYRDFVLCHPPMDE